MTVKLVTTLRIFFICFGLIIVGLLDGWYDSLGVFLCLYGYSMEISIMSRLKPSISNTLESTKD